MSKRKRWSLESLPTDGERPLTSSLGQVGWLWAESHSLGVECKLGGNYHPTLNIAKRPIANKYREGKLKSTPKGELKYLKSLWWKRVPYFVRQRATSWRQEKAFRSSCHIMQQMVFMIWHTTRLETRTKELNICASVRIQNSNAKWKHMLSIQQQPTT